MFRLICSCSISLYNHNSLWWEPSISVHNNLETKCMLTATTITKSLKGFRNTCHTKLVLAYFLFANFLLFRRIYLETHTRKCNHLLIRCWRASSTASFNRHSPEKTAIMKWMAFQSNARNRKQLKVCKCLITRSIHFTVHWQVPLLIEINRLELKQVNRAHTFKKKAQ